MGTYNAHQRAKLMGLGMDDTEGSRRTIAEYLERVDGKDNRRIMWLVGRCLERTADKIEGIENAIVCEKHFGRDVAQLEADMAREVEDFKFLQALKQLLTARLMEGFAKDIAELFGKKKFKGK